MELRAHRLIIVLAVFAMVIGLSASTFVHKLEKRGGFPWPRPTFFPPRPGPTLFPPILHPPKKPPKYCLHCCGKPPCCSPCGLGEDSFYRGRGTASKRSLNPFQRLVADRRAQLQGRQAGQQY